MKKNQHFVSLSIIASLFFIFGFITCLNDILVPHLKSLFTLNYTQAMLVQFCFFSAYFFMSIPSGKIAAKIGYQKGLVLGLVVTAIGALGFYPSAGFRSYEIFLISLFVLASGITLLQVVVNPYVTLLGEPEHAAGRLTLVQAFNSVGTTIAPIIGTALILSKNTAQNEAESVQHPYLVLGAILIFLAVIMSKVKLPSFIDETNHKSDFKLLKNPLLILGSFGIFAYVGAEVSIGSLLISWLGEPSTLHLTPEQAGKYVSFYWGSAMVGRFLTTPLLMKFKPGKILSIFATICIGLLIVAMMTNGLISAWSMILIGLFNSLMFPTIFSLSVRGLNQFTSQASGILCTFIVGGAIVPVIQGFGADRFGLRYSYVVPLFFYAYIVLFGILESKFNNSQK